MIVKWQLFLMVFIGYIGIVPSYSVLQQVHIVFRHGERNPTETYKNDPYINTTWPGGWGQLTNRGKLQLYELGLFFRQHYKDFIPEYYFPQDVNVRSSYQDRCLMSAELLLAGLFPPKNEQVWNNDFLWQPIPVHYTPRDQDTLIVMKVKCKKYDDEFMQVQKSEPFQKINNENKDLYNYLTKHTGEKIDSIAGVEKLYHTINIEVLQNFTLPSWMHNVSLNHMKTLAARYLESFTETDYMKRMKGGMFLKEVVSAMEKVERNDTHPLLYLYSAHDLTLINILNTLGYRKPVLMPDFGASFVMELYDDMEIRMIYQDGLQADPVEIVLGNCQKPCLLHDFKYAIKHFIPTDYETECK